MTRISRKVRVPQQQIYRTGDTLMGRAASARSVVIVNDIYGNVRAKRVLDPSSQWLSY